jgi:dihydrofolate reductase
VQKLIATVFNYSLNGLLADEGTDFWRFCFGLLDEHGGADHDERTLEFLRGASAHLMGRTAYEGMSGSLPGSEHPWAEVLTAGRKVVLSRTLTSVDWANTTIAAGDTRDEVDALRQDGDGHVIVWGGVTLWRSLMELDLIDEFHVSMYPYVADTGTLLFDQVPPAYALELVSSTPDDQGVLQLHFRRRR